MIASFGGAALPSRLEQPCPSFLFSFPSLHLLAFLLEQNNTTPARTPSWQRQHKGILQVVLEALARSSGRRSEAPLGFLGPLQLSLTPSPTEPSVTQETWLRRASLLLREALSDQPSWSELTQAGLGPSGGLARSPRHVLPKDRAPSASSMQLTEHRWAPGVGRSKCSQMTAAGPSSLGHTAGWGPGCGAEGAEGEKVPASPPAGSALPRCSLVLSRPPCPVLAPHNRPSG